LVKQEPGAYSWADFVRDKGTAWTGVRNYQARNNLRAMRRGDLALFYHSVAEKSVVGIAKVTRTAYRDPSAEGEDWDCVDLVPLQGLARPISLEEIKTHPELKEMVLLRNSRLSVQPLSAAEFSRIVELGGG
jgi:predicted RNA-binding protein with PUA-like domain